MLKGGVVGVKGREGELEGVLRKKDWRFYGQGRAGME